MVRKPEIASKSTLFRILIGTLAVMLGSAVLAQQATVAPVDSTANLILFVSAQQSQSRDDLEYLLRDGVDKTADCDCGSINPREISRDVYYELARFFTGSGLIPTPTGDILLEPRPGGGSSYWTVHLKDPQQSLRSMRLILDNGDEVVVRPNDPDDAAERLVFRSLGGYHLKIDPKWTIKSYQATVFVDNNEEQIQELPIENWPEDQFRYWLIEMSAFQGGDAARNALFQTLQDPKKTPSPLKSVSAATATTVAVASFVMDLPEKELMFEGNLVTFRIMSLPNRFPRRALMKFPLEANQWERELATLRSYGAGTLAGRKLSETIQNEGVVPASADTVLSPDGAAAWYEIPMKDSNDPQQGFSRSFVLDDIQGWKAKRPPNVWRLVIWEFDDGRTKSAILVKDRDHQTGAAIDTYVVGEEVEGWPVGILNVVAPAGNP